MFRKNRWQGSPERKRKNNFERQRAKMTEEERRRQDRLLAGLPPDEVSPSEARIRGYLDGTHEDSD